MLDDCLWLSPSFAYGNIIRNDPTLVDLAINVFVLCTNVENHLFKYSWWVELSMYIHEGKG